MPTLLGIDTGGTYTDAVLLDEAKGILAAAKSPTTPHDLTIGIRKSVQKLFSRSKPHINLVSLSSTLATNAVVEGKGRPAGLILIGYDPDLLESDTFNKIRSENPVMYVKGGHRISGDEQYPLDRKGIKDAVKAHSQSVSAFAVSGFFSVRNPSHELAAKAIIKEMAGLPVTCGHELTTRLDAPRRAITTLLNARLIPLIHDLIRSVEKALGELGIHAPLMIVKGDGSLISVNIARDVPIETILSGPAASIVGAQYLTGLQDALIIDMGGTTSDIAVIKGTKAQISEESASIGGYHPMVESIDVFTEGIGGDSWIRADKNGKVQVGPKRVLPLCILGHRYPEIIGIMHESCRQIPEPDLPLFILKQVSAGVPKNLTAACREVLHWVEDAPLFVPPLLDKVAYRSIYSQGIAYLLKEGWIGASSFTPTDAVNVLGIYQTGSSEAARMGAEIIVAEIRRDMAEFCKMSIAQVQYELASALVRCALRSDDGPVLNEDHMADSFFIHRALKQTTGNLINCSISLSCPIVAVGAPAGTYLPEVASLLGCDISVPDNAAVANAIGAVTGVISQTVNVLIKPVQGGMNFRVHSPEGIRWFENLMDAEKCAVETANRIAAHRARTAGADQVEVHIAKKRLEFKTNVSGDESEIVIETEITATAVGRPRMGA
jgi:N-methylhydantoinase A/oxoprolinase/acetone carboxylase beta subunit